MTGPTGSVLTHLECPRCGERLQADRPTGLCGCGSPLLARYDLAAARAALPRERLAGRRADLWRYAELLPVRDWRHVTTLGEGWTPLLPAPRLGRELGLSDLWLKDEGQNPTATFKARGAAVGVSRARELGVAALQLPTAGNAGGAWAAYAARAGLPLVVAMPADAPGIHARECAVTGARTVRVRGLISDAGAVLARYARRSGAFDAGTLREPYRVEGKKTMGYEIAEQLGWELPDVLLYPAGGGVGIIGIHKALHELTELGWVRGRPPRLVVVQAAGCRPLVEAFARGAESTAFWEGARTLAAGLRVPKPLGDFLVLRAVRETGGTAVAVDDAEILAAMRLVARCEGLWICPEGAAAVAAAGRLRASGWLGAHERVVVLNTGAGVKYPELVPVDDLPEIGPEGEVPD
jgi:threonine synthase